MFLHSAEYSFFQLINLSLLLFELVIGAIELGADDSILPDEAIFLSL